MFTVATISKCGWPSYQRARRASLCWRKGASVVLYEPSLALLNERFFLIATPKAG